mgnify:CR=1 FL=1
MSMKNKENSKILQIFLAIKFYIYRLTKYLRLLLQHSVQQEYLKLQFAVKVRKIHLTVAGKQLVKERYLRNFQMVRRK